MKNILVATDGSRAARAAVDAGIDLARDLDARVTFVHVVPPIDFRKRFGPIEAIPHELKVADDAALDAAAALAEERDVPYNVRLVAGFEDETILRLADELDAEMIVLGSRRHGTVASAFLGSVSTQVVRKATRPVLVAHPVATPVEAAV